MCELLSVLLTLTSKLVATTFWIWWFQKHCTRRFLSRYHKIHAAEITTGYQKTLARMRLEMHTMGVAERWDRRSVM